MATDLVITDITNGSIVNNKWSGTGIFDKLFAAVTQNIELQYSLGRIKGPEYATVYLGSLQAVLQQSIEYALKEKLTEVQIDLAVKDIAIKDYEATVLQPDQHTINMRQSDVLLGDIAIKEEQRKGMLTERVAKDKQAAMLGMDNVMKNANMTPENVYTPKYGGV